MRANEHLQDAANHLDGAIQSLCAAMWQMSPIATLVIEPIISVLGPLAERIRKVVQVNQE